MTDHGRDRNRPENHETPPDVHGGPESDRTHEYAPQCR